MKKILIFIKELAKVLINLSVFATVGYAAILLTNLLMAQYPDLNIWFRLGWFIGIVLLWINTLRVDWVSWIFKDVVFQDIKEGEK